jgi:hypothetical protein
MTGSTERLNRLWNLKTCDASNLRNSSAKIAKSKFLLIHTKLKILE